MRLRDLFQPRYLHSDPGVRVRAVARVHDQVKLARIAANDEDGDVRIGAGRRITDPVLLERIVRTERDRRVRLAIIGTLTDRRVILGLLESGACDPECTTALVGRVRDQQDLSGLARTNPDAAVRREAVRRVTDASVLEQIVLTDADGGVRRAAAGALQDASAVARLLETEHLDPDVVGAFDGDVFRAAAKHMSKRRPLADLAAGGRYERIRTEAARLQSELSIRFRELLSEKPNRYGSAPHSWPGRVNAMLEEGADAGACDADGRPALCVASQYGEARTVARLLERGADVNARTPDGMTALQTASRAGHPDVVQQLLSSPGVRREDAAESVNRAFQAGEVESLTRLLLFLDSLRSAYDTALEWTPSEPYPHIRAVQVGRLFAVVVLPSGYCRSILDAIKSFATKTFGWSFQEIDDIRRRRSGTHLQITVVDAISDGSGVAGPIGHFLTMVDHHDPGMGFESSSVGGGVLLLHLDSQPLADAAGQLVALTRVIDEKTKG